MERKPSLIPLFKPAGFSTHSPSESREGFVELASRLLNLNLKVIHRLDRETSGLLIVSDDPEVASQAVHLFKTRQAQKKYLFISEHPGARSEMAFSSRLEKGPTQAMLSHSDGVHNATTRFLRLHSHKNFTLWEARPLTGRTHQIRVHAQALGIPILGDTIYGQSSRPAVSPQLPLCLHSQSLVLPELGRWECPPPHYFENLELLEDAQLCNWLHSWWRRESLRHLEGLAGYSRTCRRRIHTENQRWRCDEYQGRLWFYDFSDESTVPDDLARIQRFQALVGAKSAVLRKMWNRGAHPGEQDSWLTGETPVRWETSEGDMRFEIRTDCGQSPGLFLDQAPNRNWVRHHAKGRRVLNLFAYSGGFSVAAYLGGASQIVTVDSSQTALDWCKHNLIINGDKSEEAETQEFWAVDARMFLKGCVRRNRLFDLIICDPPSYSRGKEGLFRIQRDWRELLENLGQTLAPGGTLLFSCNYEGWTVDAFRALMSEFAASNSLRLLDEKDHPRVGFGDFELPGQDLVMKAAWFERTSKHGSHSTSK